MEILVVRTKVYIYIHATGIVNNFDGVDIGTNIWLSLGMVCSIRAAKN